MKFTGAAKIASTVMLQEMFSSKLLNLICIYSLLKWFEMPSEERVEICDPISEQEEDVRDDDIVSSLLFTFTRLLFRFFSRNINLSLITLQYGKKMFN